MFPFSLKNLTNKLDAGGAYAAMIVWLVSVVAVAIFAPETIRATALGVLLAGGMVFFRNMGARS